MVRPTLTSFKKMRSLLALIVLLAAASCSTVKVSETVYASRQATRDAFGTYVAVQGGFILHASDMTARAEMPAYGSAAERFLSTMMSGNTRREILLANFAGNNPCILTLIPQTINSSVLGTIGVPANKVNISAYLGIAREIKLLAEASADTSADADR